MVRKANIKDANRIAEIHICGWRFAYKGLLPDAFLFRDLEIVQRASYFTKVLEEGNEDIYVYDEDNIIKGFMRIGKCRDENKEFSYELYALYVDPFLARNGVGSQLMNYLEQFTRELGYKEIVVWAFAENYIGLNFYKKMGYSPDGKKKILEKFNKEEVRYIKSIQKASKNYA